MKSMLAKTLQADEGGAAVAQPTSDAVSNAAAASAWRAWCGPHGGPIGEPNAGRRASIITLLYCTEGAIRCNRCNSAKVI